MPVFPLLAMVFNMMVCFGIPLGVLVYLAARRRRQLLPYAIGVLTFLASQVFTRIPLLQLLRGQPGFVAFTMMQPALYALFLGFTAGLFEECGRLIAMGALRKHRTFADALAFGVGHGGVEAAMVGVQLLAALGQQQAALAAAPPLMIALSGIERLFAMVLHVALSVFVMYGVAHKKPLWVVLALLLHTATDAAIGLIPLVGGGLFAIEATLILFALLSALLALGLRRRFAPLKGGTP